MKLYVYDHCPYCVRVRLYLGVRDIKSTLIILANDDAETPEALIGKKMVPILVKDDGTAMGESLDIVDYLDEKFSKEHPLSKTVRPELQTWIDNLGKLPNKLMMPRCVKLRLEEFKTPSAIEYFTTKKEDYIGNFQEHLNNSEQYIKEADEFLKQLQTLIHGETYLQKEFSLEDILVFPILRNLTMVKGLHWPESVKKYVTNLAKKAHIPLFADQAI